ncbi:IclR family transcriptional regulator [Propionibacteriaceae bacterium Y2011]|uniref:IclR family transcriptional regulator n=1 Tax=Microlunatus sp. Y2014 TaxID=3418488 RepID=UPI003B4EA03D
MSSDARQGSGSGDYSVGPVKRALAVLSHIGESDDPIGLAEVSTALGIPKSTTYKYLQTLRDAGFVVQNDEDSYQLGPAVWRLNRGRHMWRVFQTLALPHLHALRDRFGETTAMVELNGLETRCIATAESPQRLRVGLPVGHRSAVHSTAGGKALLAYVPAQWQRMHTPLEMKPATPATITDFDVFTTELREVERRGWALEQGEDDAHTSAVAAPVLDRAGRSIVAITVIAPTTRLSSDRADTIGQALVATAAAIGEELGMVTRGAASPLG